MKNLKLIILLILPILIFSCEKKNDKWEGDTLKSFKIEGYIYKSSTNLPVKNLGIALRQSDEKFDPRYDYRPSDPNAITDSLGKFTITYYPSDFNGGVNLYRIPSDYTCCIGLDIIDNISKGVDIQLGKVYID